MNMELEQYWPQHKVFFIATVVLFPESLKDKIVTEMFYKHYFPKDEIFYIGMMLEEYRKYGYIQYVKDGDYAYKITVVHTDKAMTDLVEYLKKWKHNELLSLPAGKPPDAAHQQTLLLNAVAQAYTNNQKEPRITLKDVYGDPCNYTYTPPFWELVLSCQLLDKKVKIKYMNYDRRASRLYDDNAQPVVDFHIVSKVFKRAATKALPQTIAKSAGTGSSTITIRSYDPDSGILFFSGQEIQIILQKSRRGKAVVETTQGIAMRKLFKDVNTLRNGVPLRTIISVSSINFDAKKRKQATNHLTEINRKIQEATGVPKLVIYDQVKYYIDKSYLN